MPTMYVRIADDLARQIAAGDLSPGDRVPSTRQIAAQRGVAMATATKALAELQRRGLVRSVVGVGTVVADAAGEEALALPTASLGARTPMASSPRRTATVGEPTITGRSSPALTRAADMQGRIVEAAIRLADSEGIGAVSMRRIGIELGVPTMSLYRWVPSKDDLTLYMLDATLGTMTWPDPPPPGWRAQLEYAARGQWAVTRAHPWLAQLLSMTRPQIAPNAMMHTEWSMRALVGVGLTRAEALRVALTVVGFVIGTALALDNERQAQRDTGITSDEWMATQEARLRAVFASGRYPVLASLSEEDDFDAGLDGLFETGLAIILDGVSRLVESRGRDERAVRRLRPMAPPASSPA